MGIQEVDQEESVFKSVVTPKFKSKLRTPSQFDRKKLSSENQETLTEQTPVSAKPKLRPVQMIKKVAASNKLSKDVNAKLGKKVSFENRFFAKPKVS